MKQIQYYLKFHFLVVRQVSSHHFDMRIYCHDDPDAERLPGCHVCRDLNVEVHDLPERDEG